MSTAQLWFISRWGGAGFPPPHYVHNDYGVHALSL